MLNLTQNPRAPRHRLGFTFVELVVVITIIAALAAMGIPIYQSVRKQSSVDATTATIQAVASAISSYQAKTWSWEVRITSGTGDKKSNLSYHMFDLNHYGPVPATIASVATLLPQPDIPETGTSGGSTMKYYSIDGYTPGSRPEHASRFRDGIAGQDATMLIHDETAAGDKWNARNNPWRGDKTATYDTGFPSKVLLSGYTGFLNMVGASLTLNKRFVDKRGILRDAWGLPLRIWYYPRAFGTDSFGIWSAGYDSWDVVMRNVRINERANVDGEGGPNIGDMQTTRNQFNDDIWSWR
jgi:prepilin-type N-terminal cleavage/methylation domain-containing protein